MLPVPKYFGKLVEALRSDNKLNETPIRTVISTQEESKCYEAIFFLYSALVFLFNFIGVALLYDITLLGFYKQKLNHKLIS